mgnify:FL=1
MSKKRKRAKKPMNIFLKSLLVIFLTVFICGIAVVGLVAGSLFGYVEKTDLVDVDNLRLNLTSFVYATNPETGETEELERLYDTENRIWVSSSEIPEYLKNAFIAIEDERFYSHCGFDIKRLAGATIQYVAHKGHSSYGGSTITQQLIKNLTQEDDYSVKRKIQEIYRAYNLEKQLSKDEILEYYLNTIYLSQKCNGVASAAHVYFNKEVSELSLAECASIAGITKFPTKYDPLVNPDNNKERQLIILKKMLELGLITEDEYTEAKDEKLVFAKSNPDENKNSQSYFVDAAIDQIIKDLMDKYNYTREFASKVLYNGGLRIYLSIDSNIQAKLDAVYRDDSAFQKGRGTVQPQSSMVIMDPYTGLVKALVGGRGEKEGKRTLNRATQTLRQPGSSIKPLSVYSPAIEYGLVTPSTIVNDSKISFGNWTPRNDDRRFLGRITVRAALRGSRNIPAVKICDYLTPEASFDFLRDRYHISSLIESDKRNGKVFTDIGLSQIALGGLTDGVSVLEMCAAYCVFPNGGTYIKPSTYTKVLDSNGKVLLEHDKKGKIAISETTARDMVSMMTDVVTGGTGRAAAIPGMRAAGKTGTTSSNMDRWFVGYTPYYVGAVWFGYDQQASLRGFSPNPAAVAWRKVMTEVHKGLKNKEFFDDNDSKELTVMVCADSGLPTTPLCPKVKAKVFAKGNVPKKTCNEHPYKFNQNKLSHGAAPATTTEIIKKNEDVAGDVQDEETDETNRGTQSGSSSQGTGTTSGGNSSGGSSSGSTTSPSHEQHNPTESHGSAGTVLN